MDLLTLLYPERCAACEALIDAPGLCPRCATSLYPTAPCCPVCALPEMAAVPVTCRRCLASPPPYTRTVAPWRYGGELAVAIRRLKYGGKDGAGRFDLARPLGALLAGFLPADVDVVVPVPLHPHRLRERGFSQSQAVAAVARGHARLAAPLAIDVLARLRSTDEQAGLTRTARARNVAAAFAVRPGAERRVAGRRVLLVDDVVTTGATAAACARALRAAGAREIVVAALARAES